MASKVRLLWMKWWPADWRGDIGVRALTLAARGFWAECLWIMHEADPRGHLLISGKAPSDRELAAHMGVAVGKVRQCRNQVIARQVASVTADGVLYSRRMVRDEAKRLKKQEDGRLGGNPQLLNSNRLDNYRDNQEVNQLDNPADNEVDNHVDKLHARQAQRLRDSEAQSRTRTAVAGTSNGEGADSALRTRAGAFCERYRWDLHPECRESAYLPSRNVEEKDLDSAARLCGAYDDEQLKDLARFFLKIPEDREPFLKGKQRTVTMLLNMAAPIAEKLWGNHARTA